MLWSISISRWGNEENSTAMPIWAMGHGHLIGSLFVIHIHESDSYYMQIIHSNRFSWYLVVICFVPFLDSTLIETCTQICTNSCPRAHIHMRHNIALSHEVKRPICSLCTSDRFVPTTVFTVCMSVYLPALLNRNPSDATLQLEARRTILCLYSLIWNDSRLNKIISKFTF